MRIKKKILFKIIFLGIFFSLVFVFKKDNSFSILNIEFKSGGHVNYIDSLDIFFDCPLLLNYYQSRETIDINTKLLEDSISNLDYVHNAEVYLQDNSLTILIEQNNPLLRFEQFGKSYYLNKEGGEMLATDMNVADVLFFSGDTIDKKKIYDLAYYIYEDDFMNSLIKGVHYDLDEGFIFYPRLFDIQIILGDTLGIKNKFKKIKTFYQKVAKNSRIIDESGDLQIKSIDVKYENQIICKKINLKYDR